MKFHAVHSYKPPLHSNPSLSWNGEPIEFNSVMKCCWWPCHFTVGNNLTFKHLCCFRKYINTTNNTERLFKDCSVNHPLLQLFIMLELFNDCEWLEMIHYYLKPPVQCWTQWNAKCIIYCTLLTSYNTMTVLPQAKFTQICRLYSVILFTCFLFTVSIYDQTQTATLTWCMTLRSFVHFPQKIVILASLLTERNMSPAVSFSALPLRLLMLPEANFRD